SRIGRYGRARQLAQHGVGGAARAGAGDPAAGARHIVGKGESRNRPARPGGVGDGRSGQDSGLKPDDGQITDQYGASEDQGVPGTLFEARSCTARVSKRRSTKCEAPTMKCTHAEKLIPLFSGDDLPAHQTGALRRHLESCTNCRRIAAEYEESEDWLRGFASPDLDEATLEGVRDAVIGEINRIENRKGLLEWILPGRNPRFAFAASLALLLLIAALGLLAYRRQPPHDPNPDRAEVKKGAGVRVETPPGKSSDEPKNKAEQIETKKPDR